MPQGQNEFLGVRTERPRAELGGSQSCSLRTSTEHQQEGREEMGRDDGEGRSRMLNSWG